MILSIWYKATGRIFKDVQDIGTGEPLPRPVHDRRTVPNLRESPRRGDPRPVERVAIHVVYGRMRHVLPRSHSCERRIVHPHESLAIPDPERPTLSGIEVLHLHIGPRPELPPAVAGQFLRPRNQP